MRPEGALVGPQFSPTSGATSVGIESTRQGLTEEREWIQGHNSQVSDKGDVGSLYRKNSGVKHRVPLEAGWLTRASGQANTS